MEREMTDRWAGPKSSAWLACPRPNPGASLRLFCFPYSGAGASIFYPWLDRVPATIEVCPVQLPGRESRLAEAPFTRLEPLVRALAAALLPHLTRPFAFFGHSMGALVSFELARRLRRQYGLSPVRLCVSGHSAPQLPDRDPPLHALPEAELLRQLRQLNGTPEAVLAHAELRALVLPVLRADLAVCETYVYRAGRPLDCPISACGGLEDAFVSREQLAGWRAQTGSSFSLHLFPGDHFFLNTARPLLVVTLARLLSHAPAPARSGRPPVEKHLAEDRDIFKREQRPLSSSKSGGVT